MIKNSFDYSIAILPHDFVRGNKVRRQRKVYREKKRYILLRHYSLARTSRMFLGRDLAQQCHRQGLGLLISGTPRDALDIRADGIHIPYWRCSLHLPAGWMRLWKRKPHWLITASAHNTQQMRRARLGGADIIFLSPIFPTLSHPERKALRLGQARRILSTSFKTHLGRTKKPEISALGGIDRASVHKIIRSKMFNGISGISHFWNRKEKDTYILDNHL